MGEGIHLMITPVSYKGVVNIGIVTYNSVNDLPECFAALKRQTYPEIRIIILDNHSTDDTVAWIGNHAPECELIINSENIGFGRAHNQIIAYCTPGMDDYYMLLNPDVTLRDNYIETVVNALTETGGGWASGKLLQKDSNHRPLNRIYSAGQGVRRDGFVINIGEGMVDDGQFEERREVFLVSGAAPILRGALIAAIAPDGELFDVTMFMYAEDIDMGWRARRQSWRCWYVPEAVAYHRGGNIHWATRAQAVGNVHISVLKNAYWFDLITYNAPLIIVDLCLRLVLTPSMGRIALTHTVRHALYALRKRWKPQVSRREMLSWYRWSKAQPTQQPRGLIQRIRVYMGRRG